MKTTVLVIDDSATYREAMRQALAQSGYDVLLADSGEEGLAMAAGRRPDAVIVDGLLPGIDGPTVVGRMRQDAALGRIPCILLTAYDEHRGEERGLEAGADAYLRKDEDVEMILARLSALLRTAAAPAGTDTLPSQYTARRLLAVDDSPTYVQEMADQLRQDGYDVATAGSGAEALEILSRDSFDCILMDLMMPELSGHATCRRIKADPRLRDVPLLMLTGHEDRDAMIEAFNAGADDFITKSSDLAVLKGRVRAQIRRKHYEDENRRIHVELMRKEHQEQEAEAVRRSETLLRSIIETLPLGVWVMDAAGQIRMANAAGQRIFGGVRYVGMSQYDEYKAWWPATGERVKSEDWAAARVLLNGQPVLDDIVEIERFDGERRVIVNSAFPINDPDGKLMGAIAVNQDITERQRAEEDLMRARSQAERESHFKSKFLASMSHELRTPLNAIIGFSELLERQLFGPLNERQADYVKNVLTSGRHLLDLINEILDISRIEAGRMTLSREWTVLKEVVDAVKGVVAPLAMAGGVSLQVEIPEDLPSLHVDPIRLRQVLYNLLSNAIKFTPDGGQTMLRARVADNHLHLAVQDTGVGIRAEDMPRLFREFERIEPSGAAAKEGTGLGLVLTRKLVELHGGTISVESEPGQGTTVTVVMPMFRGCFEGDKPADDASDGGPLALVVEDDSKAAGLLAGYLRAAGLSVAFAAGGEEAIRKAAELRPAVITLDVMLPDMSGLSVLGRLKTDPDTKSIPVVVVSVVDERNRGFILGASDYLVKPVPRDLLLRSLAGVGAPLQSVSGLKVLMVGNGDPEFAAVEQELRAAGCDVTRGAAAPAPGETAAADVVVVDLCGRQVGGIAALQEAFETTDAPRTPILGIVDTVCAPTAGRKEAFEKLVREDALRPDRLVRAVRRAIRRANGRRAETAGGGAR